MWNYRFFALVGLAVLAGCSVAQAGKRHRHAAYTYVRQSQYTQTTQTYTQQTTTTANVADVHGFCNWLNGLRASRGLRTVQVDGTLCNDALINSSRGFGHSYMGSARRQNAGLGVLGTVMVMWTRSAGHAAALFDPSIQWIGLGQVGSVITFSAR